MKNTYIISVGGSLVVTKEGINHPFLKKFRVLILKQLKKNKRFFLIIGGGATARNYISAANQVLKITDDDRDWLGIHSTRLNAHLLRTVFRDTAHPEIITNPTLRMKTDKKLVIAGGWKPGWSTDYVAAMIAEEYGVKTVINLSNINYVYTDDPKKNKQAEKIEKISWPDFTKIVGTKWTPGLNAPFDPIASQKGKKLGLKVAIMNGSNLKNLESFLNKEVFKGTLIE